MGTVQATAGGGAQGGTLANQTHCLTALGANCVSPCCSGAFVQEAMAGVLINADVRELLFTHDRMPSNGSVSTLAKFLPHPNEGAGGTSSSSRAASSQASEFNVPVVLGHLLAATQGQHSQLRRLVFSENFVREPGSGSMTMSALLPGIE